MTGVRNTAAGWGWPARALHWAMAAGIVAMLGAGLWAAEVEDDLIACYRLVQLHKSLGATLFALAALRLGWRLANPTPAPPPGMPRWQRRAAAASHAALYALMLAMPLTGWLMASASPLNDADAVPFRIPNEVFGLFALPDPYPVGDPALTRRLAALHLGLALALIAMIGVHAAAAIRHAVRDRDGVLRRMLRG